MNYNGNGNGNGVEYHVGYQEKAPLFSEEQARLIPEKKRQGIHQTLSSAIEALDRGEELPLNTLAGRAQEFARMMHSEHPFFTRVFGKTIRGNSVKKLARENIYAFNRIYWTTIAALDSHVVQRSIPLDTFKSSTLSFDDGNTIHYFGGGVIIALDAMRTMKNLASPKIHWDTFKYIVSSSKYISYEPVDGYIMYLTSNIVLGSAKEKLPEDIGMFVYVRRAQGSIIGAIGEYTYLDERKEALYTVPEITLKSKALVDYPASFVKRKFKNMVYKEAFLDCGIDVEVTEEENFSALEFDRLKSSAGCGVTTFLPPVVDVRNNSSSDTDTSGNH